MTSPLTIEQPTAGAGTPPAREPGPGRPYLWHVVAGIVYLVLGLVVMAGFVVNPNGRISGHLPIDNTWFEWLLSHGAYTVRHLENPFFSMRQNVPYGVNMMANTSVLGVTIPLAPVTMWFGTKVAYLVWMVGALAGTAFTTYWVLQRYVVRSRTAAIVAGAFAGFAPGFVHHANGQPNFVSNFLLPLIVARVLLLGSNGRWIRDGLLLGGLITWQVLINEEMLLVTALGSATAVLVYALMRPSVAKQRGLDFLRAMGLTAAVAGSLCAYPLWFQFAGPQTFRGMPAFTTWGEDPITWLTFSRDTLAGGVDDEIRQGLTEQNSWFGWPLVLLTLVLAAVCWRRSVPARVASVVAIVFAVLSLGPVLRIGGLLTEHKGPLAFIPEHTPIFNLMMPARLTFAVVGAITLLVALGWDRAAANGWGFTGVVPRIAIAAALIPIIPTPVPAVDERPPPAFITAGTWKEYVPAGGTLVSVPLPSNSLGRDQLGWSAWAEHEFTVPEGYFLGPDKDGAGKMGTTTTSRTTVLVGKTLREGVAPVLTQADKDAIRADVTRWNGSVVVMRAESGTDALRDLITQVYGPGTQVGDVWLWDQR
ncbi:hypothetical protein [Actinoplanes sp. NPDC051494]|uniref:hypothetical protein n=1 Tax=Actinoplanes sp. NPDC051494 TaxID=3363907 RepID=UPI00379271CF